MHSFFVEFMGARHRTLRLSVTRIFFTVASAFTLVACDRTPVTRKSDANDESRPPVNVPRTDPALKPTNRIVIPETNAPAPPNK